jgi:glutamate/tyrosine decarboxylase-like PLP-dependent enzyme
MTEELLGENGMDWASLEAELDGARANDIDHDKGLAFVVHADDALTEVGKKAYLKYFSSNGVAQGAYPSLARFEDELVRATTDLMRGGEGVVGTVMPAGTESCFMAVKAARDWAAANRPVTGTPEILVARSAYPSFAKAARYLGLNEVRVALADDLRADVAAMAQAVTDSTIMIVASAPTWCHGVFDPVIELDALARERNLWLHVDACVGGFLAPFFKKLGQPVPDFDFSLPGVTSLSADMHKYGYTPKTSSVILYRNAEYAAYQSLDFDDWPGGTYGLNAFTASRPGAPVAAAWAVMKHLGTKGYLAEAKRIIAARDALVAGIETMPALHLTAPPEFCVVTFAATGFDVFALADALAVKGWLAGRIRDPRSLHVMVVPRHDRAMPGFLAALGETVAELASGQTRTA